MLALFGTRRTPAMAAYERFVHAGIGDDSIWQHLNRQVFPGDDAFVARAHKRAAKRPDDLNIPRAASAASALPGSDRLVASRSRRGDARGVGHRRIQLRADSGAFWRSFHDVGRAVRKRI